MGSFIPISTKAYVLNYHFEVGIRILYVVLRFVILFIRSGCLAVHRLLTVHHLVRLVSRGGVRYD